MFLRNQFSGVGMFKLPLIKKQDVNLENVSLIGYDKINQSKQTENIVHFFLDDYRFESVYKNTDEKVELLKKFKAVLSPDFSMFTEMPIPLQMYNCFRNRWTGAYLQKQGVTVIPTVRWGDLASFSFCFDGIEKGSIVAVSTLGVRNEKSHFMLGYEEMRRRIKPSKIICYGKPFDEMKGDIIEVDYAETNYAKLYEPCFVKKCIGYIIPNTKGGGSASGRGAGNPAPNNSNSIPEKRLDDLPENVRNSYKKYEEAGWKGARKDQNPKTKAGGIFENEPPKLPKYDSNGKRIEYREYDVNGKISGRPRDRERFVRGNDGSTYYTNNHYETFTKIR